MDSPLSGARKPKPTKSQCWRKPHTPDVPGPYMDERSVITIGTAITKKFRKSAVVGVAALVQFAFLLAANSQTLKTAATPGAVGQPSSLTQGQQDWPVFGGSPENNQYSSLAQMNRSNVQRLQVAWKFDTEEGGGRLETNPIIVDAVLYAYTSSLKVIALDAATGKLLWKFDSGIDGSQPSRGLTYWTDGKENRIFAGVMSFLYALDVNTGKPIRSFVKDGRIDLRENLGRTPVEKQSVWLTTPFPPGQRRQIFMGRIE